MLLRQIEQFLTRTRMPWTVFGRRAVHDPRFVSDLRNGRQPRPATVAKVLAYIAEHQETPHAH